MLIWYNRDIDPMLDQCWASVVDQYWPNIGSMSRVCWDSLTENARHWHNAVLMLAHSLRRPPSSGPQWQQRALFSMRGAYKWFSGLIGCPLHWMPRCVPMIQSASPVTGSWTLSPPGQIHRDREPFPAQGDSIRHDNVNYVEQSQQTQTSTLVQRCINVTQMFCVCWESKRAVSAFWIRRAELCCPARPRGSICLYKAKQQYLLTCEVSIYCHLALHGRVALCFLDIFADLGSKQVIIF